MDLVEPKILNGLSGAQGGGDGRIRKFASFICTVTLCCDVMRALAGLNLYRHYDFKMTDADFLTRPPPSPALKEPNVRHTELNLTLVKSKPSDSFFKNIYDP